MINEVRLIGNVGQEPEIRTGGSGRGWTKANLSLATTRKWKDKDGNWQEKTSWHKVVVWGYLAEYVEKFVTKGTTLYVSGAIEYGSYEKDGVTRYFTEIISDKVRVMNRWKNEGEGRNNNGGYDQYGTFPEPPPIGDDVPF